MNGKIIIQNVPLLLSHPNQQLQYFNYHLFFPHPAIINIFHVLQNYAFIRHLIKAWYDGYVLRNCQVYNPKAIVSVMLDGEFKSYWSETASYEAIVPLINMDYDGLKTAIIEMLSGVEVKVDTSTFGNDISNIQSKDDVLTYMIHLGYLGYDQTKKMAFVPNLLGRLLQIYPCNVFITLLVYVNKPVLSI